jgi:N-acetylneuraminic acid mutarotase
VGLPVRAAGGHRCGTVATGRSHGGLVPGSTIHEMQRLALCVVILLFCASVAGAAPARWRQDAPLPAPRSEVAAALAGGSIYVVGGFTPEGQASARVDAYSPATNNWRRLPDLPNAAHHPMAAGYRGRLYVVGGYTGAGQPLSSAHVLVNGRWSPLPSMPEPRAAAGAAFVGGRLYVVGGVVRTGGQRLATQALRYNPATRRWSRVPSPTPREHLGVTALNGRVYAVAGRKFGFDTNLDLFESYRPGARAWRRHAPVPGKRGGTAAGAVGRSIVSIGGEAFTGTIRTVFAYDVVRRRWRRLPDLPSPRHGLGVVGARGRIYAVAGGLQPGLAGVSGANESLAVR